MDNDSRIKFYNAFIKNDFTQMDHIVSADGQQTLIKFYRGIYQGETNFNMDALKAKQLWLSAPQVFNDPFDCAICVDYLESLKAQYYRFFTPFLGEYRTKAWLNSEVTRGRIENIVKEVEPVLKVQDEQIQNSIFVSSFSERKNLKSLRMWGHYANYHKGFCCEYDIKQMFQRRGTMCIGPVKYQTTYSVKDYYDDSEGRRAILDIIYTKAKEWEYENEWRVTQIAENRNMSNGFLVPFINPIRIYLGCKIEKRLEQELVAYCGREKIELYQMYMKRGSYCLAYHEKST